MVDHKSNTSVTQLLWLLLFSSLALHWFFIWYFGDIGFEHDSYLHFLYSLTSFAKLPGSLYWAAGVWPKPVFTLLTGFVIWATGVQSLWIIKVFNTLIWIAMGLVTYRLARRLGLSVTASFIAIFLLQFSFLGFRAAIGALTEPLFAFLALVAILALYNKHHTTSFMSISLSALARSEGLLLLPAWVIILWVFHKRRNFLDLLWLVIFLLLWNWWGYSLTGDLTFIVTSGYPVDSPFGLGGWFYYPRGLFQYEPIIFPLAILGFGLTFKKGQYYPLHLLLLIFFTFNIVAWRFGRFGTAGLLRYFVPVVPWLALYAASTVDFTKLFLIRKRSFNPGSILLPLQVVFTLLVLNSHTVGYGLYNTPTVHPALVDAGKWIRAHHAKDYLYSSHPTLIYYAGRNFYSSSFLVNLENHSQVNRDGIFAFDHDFGTPELGTYLASFELIKSFGDFIFLYDLTSVEVTPKMTFGREDIRPYLRTGWADVEDWGTWGWGHRPKWASIQLAVGFLEMNIVME